MALKKGDGSLFPDFTRRRGPSQDYETRYRGMGFTLVAGVDEAGRGPLAGPVVAAAVILPEDIPEKSLLRKVRDSKTLDAEVREDLYQVIVEQAGDWAFAMCDHEEIDRMNILAASLEAMRRSLAGLRRPPDLCLVDGNIGIPGRIPSVPVVKGDNHSFSIAAASIIAKVVRDRIMAELDEKYPGYGFGVNKGYGTAQHKQAIIKLGPCPVHRKTFRRVRECL